MAQSGRLVSHFYRIPLLNNQFAPGCKTKTYQPIDLYRKFKADHIFNGSELLEASHVLVTENDGTVVELVSINDAGADVENFEGIISPGFINCHCHIELSYLKNKIPEHTGLVDFVLAVLENRNVDPTIKMEAMQAAAIQLYESGTVAVGDICNDAASVEMKRKSPVHWTNFIEISGFVSSTAEQRFKSALQVAEDFASLPFPYSIVPHASYSVSENLFTLINEFSKEIISIHNQENADEDALFKNKSGPFLKLYDRLGIDLAAFRGTGKSSLQSWLPYFTHDQKIISVHNTFTSQADIDVAKNLFYCLCINANLYIENKLPPIELLMHNQCNIVVGTDSYASNHQLNMLEEMKMIQKHFPKVSAGTILEWATKNGAEALGLSHRYGAFAAGKKPGIVLIENTDSDRFSEGSRARRLL